MGAVLVYRAAPVGLVWPGGGHNTPLAYLLAVPGPADSSGLTFNISLGAGGEGGMVFLGSILRLGC
jgi:hypothetical protein